MININEYRRILAYFRGEMTKEELTKKELKYAKKQVDKWLEVNKEIEQLKNAFHIQEEFEKEKKDVSN